MNAVQALIEVVDRKNKGVATNLEVGMPCWYFDLGKLYSGTIVEISGERFTPDGLGLRTVSVRNSGTDTIVKMFHPSIIVSQTFVKKYLSEKVETARATLEEAEAELRNFNRGAQA